MAKQLPIYDDIKLYTTSDRFFLEPTDAAQDILVIDRITTIPTVYERSKVSIPIPANAYRPICGFLGTIKLLAGNYLVVATYRKLVGKMNGHDIYELAGSDLIPYTRSETHLTQEQIAINQQYIRMIKLTLDTPGIYFSYTYDITHTLQRLNNVSAEFKQMSLLARADPRFLWNGHLLSSMKDRSYSRYTLPIIQGFVSINRVAINGKYFTWCLISRRSVFRAGTRLFVRGIDAQGNVANFVETEQIIERGNEKSSYVQTRGSIPLFWQQFPNLKYKPRMTIQPEDHLRACKQHFTDQVNRYGGQVAVNLVNHSGNEGELEGAYREAISALAMSSVRYEYFDFHTECRNMKYERLNVLVDRIAHEQDEFSYFISHGGSVLADRDQRGVFRTNCIDCLDRTNVVQSLLARRNLNTVLRVMAVLAPGETIDQMDTFEPIFKTVWADHGDMISVQYSGTGALKSDFTRTGKRTSLGVLNDGVNSLARYYKNNFCDGFRQDGIDLFMGNYEVMEGEGLLIPCPLTSTNKDWKIVTVPSVLLVAASMFCASVILPSEYSSEILLYLMFWGGMVGATLTYIFRHGKEFVDYPHLNASMFVPITVIGS